MIRKRHLLCWAFVVRFFSLFLFVFFCSLSNSKKKSYRCDINSSQQSITHLLGLLLSLLLGLLLRLALLSARNKIWEVIISLAGLALEIGTLDKIWDIVIVGVTTLLPALLTLLLLEALEALGKFPQLGKGFRTQLIENARDKLSQLLILAVTIDSKSVRRNGGVNCYKSSASSPQHSLVGMIGYVSDCDPPFGAEK